MPKVRIVRWVLGATVAAIAVTGFALLFAPRPVEVETRPVARGPIAETVSDQGYAKVREAYVVAAPASGRLERINLKVGDRVIAGRTVVATIVPAGADLLDLRARAQAEAAVSAAEAAVAAAAAQQAQISAEAQKSRTDLQRARRLFEQGFVAAQALDAAEAQARASDAAERAAAAQLSVRRSELAASRSALLSPEARGGAGVTVRSPASGYVTRVLEESERTVSRGVPLVEIGDGAQLEAAIEFLTQDAVRIREGMRAEVYDWGGAGALSAVVRRVEPQGFTKVSALGVEEQRVLVLLRLTANPTAWSRLGPGYRLWGRVELRRADNAVKAPIGALVRDRGQWAVYRVADGRARLARVQVAAITDEDVEILGGIAAGDRVVNFPSDKVRDGVRVRER